MWKNKLADARGFSKTVPFVEIRASHRQTKKSASEISRSRTFSGKLSRIATCQQLFPKKRVEYFSPSRKRGFLRYSRDLFPHWPCIRANRTRFPLPISSVDQTHNLFLKSFRKSSIIRFSLLIELWVLKNDYARNINSSAPYELFRRW